MSLGSGLIAYAALVLFAVTSRQYRHTVRWQRSASPNLLRAIGTVVLLLSVTLTIVAQGVAQGTVAWAGQISVAGMVLVLLLSWRPRLAIWLGLPMPLAAMVLALA